MKKNRFKIYNLLQEHVRLAKYEGDIEPDIHREIKGYGIVLNKKYITVAHIPDALENQVHRTPFGIVKVNIKIKNKKATLEERLLREVVMDVEKDVAVYDILTPQSEKDIEDFPCKPQTKYNLGDEIYVIGNPQLKGSNIRKGYVCDLDSFGESESTKHCFGIDTTTIGGDSGCPVVNKDFELLGLVRSSFAHTMGYVNKIENFMPYLNGQKVRKKIENEKK